MGPTPNPYQGASISLLDRAERAGPGTASTPANVQWGRCRRMVSPKQTRLGAASLLCRSPRHSPSGHTSVPLNRGHGQDRGQDQRHARPTSHKAPNWRPSHGRGWASCLHGVDGVCHAICRGMCHGMCYGRCYAKDPRCWMFGQRQPHSKPTALSREQWHIWNGMPCRYQTVSVDTTNPCVP